MTRVSVIMPAHNAAAVIEQALESVLGQTFTDWEVVVSDDASDDETAATAAAYSSRVRVFPTPRNLGPAAARNVALQHADGELIAFLDADDWWLPEYLEQQVLRYEQASAQPGAPVGIVACNARIAKPDGTFEPYTYYDQFRRGVEPVTVERLLRRNVLFVSSLVPRPIGEEVGWFDERLFGTEDHGLWLKIAERGYRVVVNREPLAVYRRTEGSVSNNLARQAVNNRKTLVTTKARGCLTPRQERIVAQELRYNRALEAVGGAVFGGGTLSQRAGRIGRSLPIVLWVALTRPRNWPDWWDVLRSR
jgi:glycosyltransferase involved in cell wall biosynthesis